MESIVRVRTDYYEARNRQDLNSAIVVKHYARDAKKNA